MTNEEAEEMLKKLSEHYQQPVMPVRKYCAALETWMRCIEYANRNYDEKTNTGGAQGRYYFKHLRNIWIDVRKSGLLERLIYLGEKERYKECPTHKGRMNTAMWCGFPGEECVCQGTGWLPEW